MRDAPVMKVHVSGNTGNSDRRPWRYVGQSHLVYMQRAHHLPHIKVVIDNSAEATIGPDYLKEARIRLP